MLDNSPYFTMIELDETLSTNSFLKDYHPIAPTDITLVTAEYQSAGRGQAGNSWESERGKNLLFSLQVRPSALPAASIFVLSEAIALSLRDAVLQILTSDPYNPAVQSVTPHAVDTIPPVTVKWPNDIYVADSKIAGILIENSFLGNNVEHSIIGCGININQQNFHFPKFAASRSDGTPSCPIPVSLFQLLGHETERQIVLETIITAFRRRYEAIQVEGAKAITAIHNDFRQALYRREGFHAYRDATGIFNAEITDVEPSGHLLLCDANGHLRRYAFKEVSFCQEPPQM